MVWPRIAFEDQLPPSIDALQLHWLRTLWVADYWSQATRTNIYLLPLDSFGWMVNGNVISVEWDSPENIRQVKNRAAFLTHGCNCKTGCTTLRCKCVKSGRQCGPGCGCCQCQNQSREGMYTSFVTAIMNVANDTAYFHVEHFREFRHF